MKHLSYLCLLLVTVHASAIAGVAAGAAKVTAAARTTSNSAPLVSADAARASGVSLEELKDATKLYTTKCMRCHKSYEPSVYELVQWDGWMTKMKKKAHLNPDQERLLLRYLGAYRAAVVTTKTNDSGPVASVSNGQK